MGATKNYFKDQFQLKRFVFEHEEAWDFYLCCWQKNRSPLILMCVRLLLFVGCLAILISSLVLTAQMSSFIVTEGYWFIYMTHWGIIMITVTSGFSFAVSVKAYFKGPMDSTFGLPWLLKLYWIAYDITLPNAFFITVFYYALLTDLGEEYAVDPVLDVFIHGINSVLMFALLITAQHPSHILHFVYPLLFGLVYLLFGVIYYFAGGTDPRGNSWIYPMIDWSDPGPTTVYIVLSAVGIVAMHIIIVLISLLRDYLSKKYVRNNNSMSLAR